MLNGSGPRPAHAERPYRQRTPIPLRGSCCGGGCARRLCWCQRPSSCRPVDPTSDAVAELAGLFELYRIHYGQSPAPAETRAWVGEMARSGELEFYGANYGPRMVGFAAIHQIPASLVLGRFWQLRG